MSLSKPALLVLSLLLVGCTAQPVGPIARTQTAAWQPAGASAPGGLLGKAKLISDMGGALAR